MNQKTAQKLLEKVVDDYDNISKEFDQTRKSDWKEFKLFLDYIHNGDHVVDLGCGNGRLFSFLHNHLKIQYHGIDNSKNLLKKAKINNPEAKFSYGDLLETGCSDSSTDVVAAIASFHHLPSTKLREKSLKEIRRILKENGTLIITAWNLFQPKYKKYIWKARLRHILSFGRYDWRDTLIPWAKSGVKRYYYAFTAKELKKLLINAGFTILLEKIDRNIVLICKKSSK